MGKRDWLLTSLVPRFYNTDSYKETALFYHFAKDPRKGGR